MNTEPETPKRDDGSHTGYPQKELDDSNWGLGSPDKDSIKWRSIPQPE